MIHLERKIEEAARNKDIIIIAIDGPCAGGKTTFSSLLAEKFESNLFHMDDFFLRPEQRSPERLNEPGGNIDYERFKEEVLCNIVKGIPFKYNPFCCSKGMSDTDIEVPVRKINIVEGVYSMHPCLSPFYDIKIFINVPREEQLRRLKKRDSSKYMRFINEWIPLEDKYFSFFNIEKSCDFIIDGITLIEI